MKIKIPRKLFDEFSKFENLKHYNEPYKLTLFTKLVEKILTHEIKKHKKHDKER